MNRNLKIAWFQLVIVGVAGAASMIGTIYFTNRYEYELIRAWWLGTMFSVPFLVLTVFGPVFFRRRKGHVDYDERDLMIDRRAMRVAFAGSYGFFVIVCFTTWLAAGLDNPIPSHYLLRLVLGGWVVSIVCHALTTIMSYGWRARTDESIR